MDVLFFFRTLDEIVSQVNDAGAKMGNTKMGIRLAEANEHCHTDALAVEAWAVLKDGYSPDQWEWLLLRIGGMSKIAEGGHILVAAEGNQIFGAVGYVPAGGSDPASFALDWPVMRMLVVRPSMRGRGIGKALAIACVQRARESGAHCIGLHTSPIMTVALPMYRRMGFVEDGEMPPIAGAPYARYVLRFVASRPASTCQN
ncbi:MAG: GNAT family N-acetyltransferase [Polyangiaceae bacterium]